MSANVAAGHGEGRGTIDDETKKSLKCVGEADRLVRSMLAQLREVDETAYGRLADDCERDAAP